jgi:DNA-directed RNA polymerase subunit RPC12/RpoP|nr:MAG TPA: hydrogenase/urease nickel incorporation protein [Caudoviricetes sp.]
MNMTREEAIKALRIEGIEIGGKAKRLTEFMVALDVAQKALRPVSRERVDKVLRGEWIAVREAVGGYKCSRCKAEAVLDCNDEFVLDNFCPRCGAAMTDEAVEMVMERLEALYENRD